jgi:hypothetical protein
VSKIAFHRALAAFVARSAIGLSRWEAPTMDGKIKAPPSARRMWLVGLKIFGIQAIRPAGAFHQIANDFNVPSAISLIGESAPGHDDA